MCLQLEGWLLRRWSAAPRPDLKACRRSLVAGDQASDPVSVRCACVAAVRAAWEAVLGRLAACVLVKATIQKLWSPGWSVWIYVIRLDSPALV